MASINRTAYPRFKPSLSKRELKALYEPTDDEIAFARSQARRDRSRLTLLVLLKCHQRLGYLPPAKRVPKRIRRYIARRLRVPKSTALGGRSRQARHRYRRAIHRFLNVRTYSEGGRDVATTAVREAAFTMSDPADLVNVAIEQLVRHRYELPAFSTLDRLVGQVRQQVHERLYEQLTAPLTGEERRRLDALLEVQPGEYVTDFTRMKETPGPATLKRMRAWSERLRWLLAVLDTDRLIEGLAYTKVRQFAAEAAALEVGDVKDFAEASKRHALLVCLLHEAQVRTRDALVEMLLKRMRRTHSTAKEKLRELQEQHREIEEEMLAAFAEVVERAEETQTDAAFGREVRAVLTTYDGAEVLKAKYHSVSAYHHGNYLPLLWDLHRRHRSALFDLLDLLRARPASQDRSLVEALHFIVHYRRARRDVLPYEIDLGFLSHRWRAFVETRHEGELVLKRRELEVCVMSHVADALRTGDLFVPGSEAYADYREQLLPWTECRERLASYCQALSLPEDAGAFVRQLQQRLDRAARRIDQRYPDNTELTIDPDGGAHLRRLKAKPVPEGAEALKEAVRDRMPERHLLDVLKHVHYWAGYTRHFGPPSGSDPKLADPVSRYLFTVFGYGCNLGAAQTARHAHDAVTLRVLKRINDQHITTERLEAAARDVIAEYARFELPFLWGSGKTAVADGTHVELVENNLLGEKHIRYGRYGGIAYHHISDTYIALFSHFIACGVWEAVYILDGLLRNQSVLQPDTVHADTQGQSEPVYGLAYLLGIKLMPRMRTWDDVAFYRPSAEATYRHIDALFTRVVDWELIEAHWEDLMQVALSIQAGKVLPSMLLRKLGTQNRRSRLYRAFRELGRVMRTLFLLEYVSEAPLRRSIHAATTKVESYNAFCDWLSFGRPVIMTGDPVEQEKRVKYLNLVANAVMLQNVVDLTDVLVQLQKEGHAVTREQVARLSPYMTAHLKRFGQYVLDMAGEPAPLEPRPLMLAEE